MCQIISLCLLSIIIFQVDRWGLGRGNLVKTQSSFTYHDICYMPIINEGYWLNKISLIVQHIDIRQVHTGNDNSLFDEIIMKDSNQNQRSFRSH